MTLSRFATLSVVIPVALLGAIQLVPYGRDHGAPPDGTRPAWDSARTQDLARRACFDCHSNETRWPWYSHIAPMSWRIQHHVFEGREKLNFSAFQPTLKDVAEAAGEAGETVGKREMPPGDYLLAHPEARLTADERQALVAGFDRTFSAWKETEHAERGAGSVNGGARAAASRERGEERDRDDEHHGEARDRDDH